MSGNIANTYFANQVAFRYSVIEELKEIDTGRIINVVSGKSVSYTIDDEYTADNYILYIPLPGTLIAAANTSDPTTEFTINNPNQVNVEFRTRDWFTGATPIMTGAFFSDFSTITSHLYLNSKTIKFKLLKDPTNPSVKVWFTDY